ncbi:SAV_915 family protein [Streptomyces sp. NPDC003077]|uniref:SAV_915 family protein n=1 Tax=Streptomyces sp. NPDC003077 TaxID=3154443 RepID=UPI0033B8065D
MSENPHPEDPEPAERVPAGPLFVPVRPGPAGWTARLFRTPLGGRTAVGFTSHQRLAATLGTGHRWVRLAEPALRALAEPLGASVLTVDPRPASAATHLAATDGPLPADAPPRPATDATRLPTGAGLLGTGVPPVRHLRAV